MAVRGMRSGWGSPDRLAEAEPEAETQPVVRAMLDGGARFAGLAQCEELCFSLIGSNAHYGAPLNPRAPDRFAGGSSSGSAALVAGGVVDVATGTDTGGSVRGPAAWTGLVGLRTTHGFLSTERIMPLAHTLDVFGWFARDARTYGAVARTILPEGDGALRRLVGIDALDALVSGEAERDAYGAAREVVLARFDGVGTATLPGSVDDWYWTFREIQAFEAWMNLGDFIRRTRPKLGPGVRERFDYAATITRDRYDGRTAERHAIIAWAEDLLSDDGCLVLPTMPSCAPLRTATQDELGAMRERALRLLCLSGLTGLPQITLPLGEVHGAPFGVSLVGPRGSDRALVELAEALLP